MTVTGKYEASNFFVRQGITIDLTENCYSKFKKLFSFITVRERCSSLPKADYLLLFRTLYAKCESCTEEDYNNNSVYQLSLVYNKNRKLIIHETGNREEVFEMSKQLASELKLRIKDSATDRRNSKWLN